MCGLVYNILYVTMLYFAGLYLIVLSFFGFFGFYMDNISTIGMQSLVIPGSFLIWFSMRVGRLR